MRIYIVLFCSLFIFNCAIFNSIPYEEMTECQKSSYIHLHDKKINIIYADITSDYSDAYGDYIDNPSSKNLGIFLKKQNKYHEITKLNTNWKLLNKQLSISLNKNGCNNNSELLILNDIMIKLIDKMEEKSNDK